jgi:hypothetical protein
MAVKLHKPGFEKAETMIKKAFEVDFGANRWEEVKPSEDDELNYLDSHSLDEYGSWYLGIDTEVHIHDQSKFMYPFGDFDVVQESALIVAHQQAKNNHHNDIAAAAEKLLGNIAHIKKNS